MSTMQMQMRGRRVPAMPESDPYCSEVAARALGLVTSKALVTGGLIKAIASCGASIYETANAARDIYGERHPVTMAAQKVLAAGVGPSGGFIVPPDQAEEIIELLRPQAVVRSAGPRLMPMPRGTMTLPAQVSPSNAAYGAEVAQIPASQPGVAQIVATYKKLTAFVPLTNDLIRYGSPAADAWVRDDLVLVLGLREDLGFLLDDGTLDTPVGFLTVANNYVRSTGGTPGVWNTAAASSWAVGGQFITSNPSYSLSTVVSELAGMINRLDSANVVKRRRHWFMAPRIYNYLNAAMNSLGVFVFRGELERGTLFGYPFSTTTQILTSVVDPTATYTNCSFVFLVEMDDAVLLDSMALELAVSREGTYFDSNNNVQSAFQKDQTLIRAVAEHDFQMRHPPSIAVAQGVLWAPTLS